MIFGLQSTMKWRFFEGRLLQNEFFRGGDLYYICANLGEIFASFKPFCHILYFLRTATIKMRTAFQKSHAIFKIIEFRYCVKVGSKLILQR